MKKQPVSAEQLEQLEQQISELTADLQHVRADFENHRKRAERDKAQLGELVKAATIMRLLPLVDDIERAITHTPAEIADNDWVQGINSLVKKLTSGLASLDVTKIEATPGTDFNPNLHEAVSSDNSTGDKEVIAEELQSGYKLGATVIRPSMVRVTRQ
jgi:molecular chaperone GrpE